MITAPDKKTFPQTPDGTTDWEVVFEDPTTGLIPMLVKAQAPEALRQGTIVIIEKLYTRKSDVEEVAKFREQIDRITFTNESVDEQVRVLRVAVSALMRTIKDDRIQKAAAFVKLKKEEALAEKQGKKRKKRKIKSTERRAGQRSKSIDALDSTTRAILWIFGFLVAGAVMAGGVFFVLSMIPTDSHQARRPTVADYRAAQQPARVAPVPDASDSSDVESDEEIEPEEEAPPPLIVSFRVMSWPMTQLDRKHRRRTIKTLMMVHQGIDESEACALAPRLVETLNIDLQEAYENAGVPTSQALVTAANNSVRNINSNVGKKLVKAIVHVSQPPKSLNTRYAMRTCSKAADAAANFFAQPE